MSYRLKTESDIFFTKDQPKPNLRTLTPTRNNIPNNNAYYLKTDANTTHTDTYNRTYEGTLTENSVKHSSMGKYEKETYT